VGRRTKRLLCAAAISKELGGHPLFRNLSFTLSPGTRLGLLGLNGTGKTTLLRILASELQPDAGPTAGQVLNRFGDFRRSPTATAP
jgi:ATP-binding cassette subfamily F protein uup